MSDNPERIVLKQFAKDAKNNGVFGSLKTGAPEIAQNINDVQKLPAFTKGWEYAVTDGTLLPALEELQGVHALFAAALKQLNSWGIVPYDPREEYFKGAVTFDPTASKYSLYVNLTGKNGGVSPKDDETNWQKINLEFEELKRKADKTFENIDSSDVAQSFKSMSISWGMPDYSAMITIDGNAIAKGFSAPSDGILTGRMHSVDNGYAGLYINKRVLCGGGPGVNTIFVMLSKGDQLTPTSLFYGTWTSFTFIPFKGAV